MGGSSVPLKDVAAKSLACLVALLVLGELVRARSAALQRLHLPASLLAGLFGVVLLAGLRAGSAAAYTFVSSEVLVGWAELPGVLTTVIFAGLTLGLPRPTLRDVWQQAGSHLLYSLALVFGQYCACILATGLFLPQSQPFIAVVVPYGFEGGHGVVSGMAAEFARVGFPEARWNLSVFIPL